MSGWWALACVAYGFVAGGSIGAAAVAVYYQCRAERVRQALAETGRQVD